jgi:hypothetical protein
MALSYIFVDPSLDANVGTGTLADPFGDLEFGIVQTTFNLSGGTQINIKAGAGEILVADLSVSFADTSVSVAWLPSILNPLIIQGYLGVRGDGGFGDISGNDVVGVIAGASYNGVHFRNMYLHNTGAISILDINNNCSVQFCEIAHTTGNAAHGVTLDNYAVVSNNYVHDIRGFGMQGGTISYMAYNRVEFGDVSFNSSGIYVNGGVAYRNIVRVNSNSDGIRMVNNGAAISNSIWSDAGSGSGVNSGTIYTNQVLNNAIEGFSDVGGVGVETGGVAIAIGANAVYDCTTPYLNTSVANVYDLGDNEILTASPFTDAANGDFSPRDTGHIREGHLPAGWFN